MSDKEKPVGKPKEPHFAFGVWCMNKLGPKCYEYFQAATAGDITTADRFYAEIVEAVFSASLEAEPHQYDLIFNAVMDNAKARQLNGSQIFSAVISRLRVEKQITILTDMKESLARIKAAEEKCTQAKNVRVRIEKEKETVAAEVDSIDIASDVDVGDHALKFGVRYFSPHVYGGGSVLNVQEDHETNDTEIETLKIGENAFGMRLASAPSLAECDDAYGVVVDEHGNVKRFAMADGVGQTQQGRAVANAAVELGLSEIEAFDNLSEQQVGYLLARIGFKIADDFDIKRLRREFIKYPPSNFGPDAVKRRAREMVMSDRSFLKNLGATNLILGAIQGSVLKVIMLSDGDFLVCNSSGIKFAGKKTDYQLDICALLDFKATLAPEQRDSICIKTFVSSYGEIQLEPGDVIFTCTDGLRFGREKKSLVDRVQELTTQGLPVEQIVNIVTRESRVGNFWEDDHTALAIRYLRA